MTRLGIRLGISRPYKDNGNLKGSFTPTEEISCFSSGRWIGNNKWINSTRWKFSDTPTEEISCFSSGRWIGNNKWINSTRWKFSDK